MCSQCISSIIKISSSVVSSALNWSLQIEWLTLFCFTLFSRIKKIPRITWACSTLASQSDTQVTAPTQPVPWHASQSKGQPHFLFSCLAPLENWLLKEGSPVMETCKWNRKSTFDWRAALEFVSQNEVETDYASRINKSVDVFSILKGGESTVYSYYCHTGRSSSLLTYLLLHLHSDMQKLRWRTSTGHLLPARYRLFISGWVK